MGDHFSLIYYFTRALIGKERENNEVEYVYCHYDGYLDGVGAILKNYNLDSLDEILKCGDMSSLHSVVGDCNFYKDIKEYGSSFYRNRDEYGIDSKIVGLDGYKDSSATPYSTSYRYLYTKTNDLVCYKDNADTSIEEIVL